MTGTRGAPHLHRLPLALGAAAALGYGFQNGASKPAAAALHWSDGGALWLIVVSQTVSIAIGAIGLLSNRRVALDFRRIYADRRQLRNIAIVESIGVSSLSIYILFMSKFDQVFVAMILNTHPFWILPLEFMFFSTPEWRRDVTPGVWAAFAICALLVAGIAVYQSGWRHVAAIPAICLVPICYGMVFLLRRRLIEGVAPLSFLIASQMFDAPVILLLCLALLSVFATSRDATALLSRDVGLFALGGAASWAALYCLHKGPALDRGPTWATSLMLFLTPLFTAGSSVALAAFGYGLPFRASSLLAVPVLFFCLLYLAYARPKTPT